MLKLKMPALLKPLCFLAVCNFLIIIQLSALSAAKTVSDMDMEAILKW